MIPVTLDEAALFLLACAVLALVAAGMGVIKAFRWLGDQWFGVDSRDCGG